MSFASWFALILTAVMIAFVGTFLCYYDAIKDFIEKRKYKKEFKKKMIKVTYNGITYILNGQERIAIEEVVEKVRSTIPDVDIGKVIAYMLCVGADFWGSLSPDAAFARDFVLMLSSIKNSLGEKK